MRIQTKAFVALVCATSNLEVDAFTTTSFATKSILFNKNAIVQPKKPYYSVVEKESNADIDTVAVAAVEKEESSTDVASKSAATSQPLEKDGDSRTSIEEKAWKIVDEKTKDLDLDTQISTAIDGSIISNESTTAEKEGKKEKTFILDEDDLVSAIEEEASLLVDEMVDEECLVTDTGEPADELCVDESKMARVKSKLKKVVTRTLGFVRTGGGGSYDDFDPDEDSIDFDGTVPEGELLEQGWEQRGNTSAIRRNAEVWKFALKCVFKALKPRKMKKSGASDDEIKEAQIDAATFVRNGLLRLGPSFVKLVRFCFVYYSVQFISIQHMLILNIRQHYESNHALNRVKL